MPKNPELVQKLNEVIRRENHKGYLIYMWGKEKGTIDGVYRSKMERKAKQG